MLISNLVFDESGFFLLYATMLGIKGMKFFTNVCQKQWCHWKNLDFEFNPRNEFC